MGPTSSADLEHVPTCRMMREAKILSVGLKVGLALRCSTILEEITRFIIHLPFDTVCSCKLRDCSRCLLQRSFLDGGS